VVWIEVNNSNAGPSTGASYDYDNYSYDVPSLGIYGTREQIMLSAYGHDRRAVVVNVSDIITNFKNRGIEPHGGYITLGDNNDVVDQIPGRYLPVKQEWVVGKAIGELPWFGLIKLSITDPPADAPGNSWTYLFAVIIILVSIPFFLDFGWPYIKKRLIKKRGGVQSTESLEEPSPEPEAPPPQEEKQDAREPATEEVVQDGDTSGEDGPSD
jgi:signal peptidase